MIFVDKSKVKIVLGANYGDEGKGLVTHYFSSEAAKDGPVLNILFNGGPQRGHTVEYSNGLRHVFHHFGSGFFDGADTYFDSHFMLNPIFFNKELKDLKSKYEHFFGDPWFNPIFEAHVDCRVITPWDSMINQIIEKSRGDKCHGSCGYGIWETEQRYKNHAVSAPLNSMAYMNNEQLHLYLEEIRWTYLPQRLWTYGISEIPEEYKSICYSSELMENYISDFRKMCRHLHLVPSLRHLCRTSQYETLIFEGGQGLALDEDNYVMRPHVTASSTGCKVPMQEIADISDQVEIVYVTRPYFTRHGAGPFPTECSKEDLGIDICDPTNIPNPYQGTLRVGKFDLSEMRGRIVHDLGKPNYIPGKDAPFVSLFITHMGNPPQDFQTFDLPKLKSEFDNVYISRSSIIDRGSIQQL